MANRVATLIVGGLVGLLATAWFEARPETIVKRVQDVHRHAPRHVDCGVAVSMLRYCRLRPGRHATGTMPHEEVGQGNSRE